MKMTVKKGLYCLAGGKYLKRKVNKNSEILRSNVHETNPKLWKKTMDDNFDILEVCIHKMRHDQKAMTMVRNDMERIIRENS